MTFHHRVSPRALTVALIMLSSGLSGCASVVSRITDHEDSNSLNPDGVQGPRGTKAPGANAAAASVLPTERYRGESYNTMPNLGAPGCNSASFSCRQRQAEADPDNAVKAAAYLRTGITLSDELCSAWFDRLGVAQVTLKQTSDTISATGSLAAAMLGFARADSRDIGAVASLFGFAKQATDNLQINYIVSVDLPTVSTAIADYRARYAEQLLTAPDTKTYETARRRIIAYDNTCSSLSVKRFVNSKVQGATDRQDGVTTLFDTAVASFVANEAKTLFGKDVTTDDVVNAYALLYGSGLTEPGKKALVAELKAHDLIKSDAVAFAKVDEKQQTAADFRAMLGVLNIESYIGGLAKAKIEALNKEPAKAPKPAAGAATSTPAPAPAPAVSILESQPLPSAANARPLESAPDPNARQ